MSTSSAYRMGVRPVGAAATGRSPSDGARVRIAPFMRALRSLARLLQTPRRPPADICAEEVGWKSHIGRLTPASGSFIATDAVSGRRGGFLEVDCAKMEAGRSRAPLMRASRCLAGLLQEARRSPAEVLAKSAGGEAPICRLTPASVSFIATDSASGWHMGCSEVARAEVAADRRRAPRFLAELVQKERRSPADIFAKAGAKKSPTDRLIPASVSFIATDADSGRQGGFLEVACAKMEAGRNRAPLTSAPRCLAGLLRKVSRSPADVIAK